MKRFVVTFARGFGSGGKEIASTLAHDLGIHCYENRFPMTSSLSTNARSSTTLPIRNLV